MFATFSLQKKHKTADGQWSWELALYISSFKGLSLSWATR